jgi:hypothetical protein
MSKMRPRGCSADRSRRYGARLLRIHLLTGKGTTLAQLAQPAVDNIGAPLADSRKYDAGQFRGNPALMAIGVCDLLS